MNVFCLSPGEIDSLSAEYWRHLERLERETGLVLASAIRLDLLDGRKQLWGYREEKVLGIAVTEILETPKGQACLIYGACGTETTKGQINTLLCAIEAWARNIGCTRMMLQGRRGWLRKLESYRQTGIILEKEF